MTFHLAVVCLSQDAICTTKHFWDAMKIQERLIPSKIEWDLYPNGPRSVSCDRAIRSSGFLGARSVGPVSQISWIDR